MEEQNKDQDKGRKIGGIIFVGCMFVGAGVGMLYGKVAIGGAIGMGLGFIAMGIIMGIYGKK